MVKSCCDVGCANRLSKGTTLLFYRFPVDPDRRSRWIAAVKRECWKPTEYSFVCSAHFISGKKSQNPLSPDFVPSIFEHIDSPVRKTKVRELKKYTTRKTLLKKKILEQNKREAEKKKEERAREAAAERAGEAAAEEAREIAARESAAAALLQLQEPNTRDAAEQTDLTISDIQCLEEKPSKVRVVEQFLLTDDVLKTNDDAVKFYTGLSTHARLKAVFDLVPGCLGKHSNSSLSLFQEFLLTLMKLRTNIRDQVLAYRFGVSQSTVSRYFRKWIDIMYIRLKPTIQWPSCEAVRKTMPFDFRKDFSKINVYA